MPESPEPSSSKFDLRLIVSILLLAVATFFTMQVVDGLAARRELRTDLAEISHARYDLLNASNWVVKITPILEARIDALDLQAANQANLRPMVENALNRLLTDIKDKMSAKPAEGAAPAGFLAAGNPLIANMMVSALRPHVPEYAGVVLAELGKPDVKLALKKYIKSVLADSAKTTFGAVDMRVY